MNILFSNGVGEKGIFEFPFDTTQCTNLKSRAANLKYFHSHVFTNSAGNSIFYLTLLTLATSPVNTELDSNTFFYPEPWLAL